MSGFKLIAIRPIKVEDTKLLKVLKEKKIYQFYSDYSFLDSNQKEVSGDEVVSSIKYTPSVPSDLFSLGGTNINVSAIVGKNGCGKSSLIELLFVTLYNLSVKLNILTEVENDEYVIEKLVPINGVEVHIYYSIDDCIFCLKMNNNEAPEFSLVEWKEKAEKRDFNQCKLLKTPKENLKKFFFYSIAINYSIYGLNSNQMGIWIKSLFHKNDGYQTPVVINPYRNKGNFDINIELYLAKQRLLSNLLRLTSEDSEGKSHLYLTDSQKVELLTFSLNENKIEYAFRTGGKESDIIKFDDFFKIENKDVLLKKIFKAFFGKNTIKSDAKFREKIEKYIIKKIIQIARTYPEYKPHFRDELIEHIGEIGGTKNKSIQHSSYFIDIETYLNVLASDKSHLTFKLRQALNYLQNDVLREDRKNGIIWVVELDEYDNEIEKLKISTNQLSGRLSEITDVQSKVIEHIPPSIFDLEIHLISNEGSESKFSELSSGEQQLIHSIQSIIYHAINLNSVFLGNSDLPDKVTYKYLNIILDEVELYFHPDYQRDFVDELVIALSRMNLGEIKNINVLFSTHSPFILSDIPSANILKLKKGEPLTENINSFGANIHDILADDFFLTKGAVGTFARRKIKETIAWLNNEKDQSNSNHHERLIKTIDEPIARRKLAEMYDNKMNEKGLQLSVVQSQINKLKELELKLKKDDTPKSEEPKD